VVAISTLRQLGIIIYSLSLGLWKLTYLHIIIHAIFKAILFIGCGSLIGQNFGNQDSRYFGALIIKVPFIGIFFGISRVCLIGFPFTCGFYSKDLILEGGLFSEYFYFSYILFLLSCVLTVIYSLRLFKLGYLNILIRIKLINIIEYKIIYISMITLRVWSISCGRIISWNLISQEDYLVYRIEKFIGIWIIIIGIIIYKIIITCIKIYKIKFYFSTIFFLPFISSNIASSLILKLNFLIKRDHLWLEIVGGQGLHKKLLFLNNITLNFIKSEFKLFIRRLFLLIILNIFI